MNAVLDSSPVGSVHGRLFAQQWAVLPAAIRRMHGEVRRRDFAGRVTIERGRGWLSRCIGRVMGFPNEADDVPIRVCIQADARGETWERDFNGSRLCSRVCARGGLLIERMGPGEFHFRLDWRDGAIQWQCVAMKVLGLRIPMRLWPRMSAQESTQGNRYCFDVSAAMPIVGLLVHYRGWLDV